MIARILLCLLFYRTGVAWLQSLGVIKMPQESVVIPPDPNDPTDFGGVEVISRRKPSVMDITMLTAASWAGIGNWK